MHPDFILDNRPSSYVVMNKQGYYMRMSFCHIEQGDSFEAVKDVNQASVFPIFDYNRKRHEPSNPDVKNFCSESVLIPASEKISKTVSIDKAKGLSHREAVSLTYLQEAETPLYENKDERTFYNVKKHEGGKITGYENKGDGNILDLTRHKDELEFFYGNWGSCVARLKIRT